MSTSALTEEELYLAELTPAQIIAKIEKDVLDQSRHLIYSVPVRTDVSVNPTVTGFSFVTKTLTDVVSSHVISSDTETVTPFQYLIITSEKLDSNEPGLIEIHFINVKLMQNGNNKLINFKISRTYKLTDISSIHNDDDKKRIAMFTFVDTSSKYRFRTEEILHITLYTIMNLLLIYYQLSIQVTGYDLVQLNVDAALKNYQNKCLLLNDEDEHTPRNDEEEETMISPELLAEQKKIQEDMNIMVKEITDKSENDSIQYVTNEMHERVKKQNNELLEALVSIEANNNESISQLKKTLEQSSTDILNLQNYLTSNTVELMKMKNALRNITNENEIVSIRKENQQKIYSQLSILLDRLTVDDESKAILQNINSHLGLAWSEASKYGHLCFTEGKDAAEAQRFKDTNIKIGTLQQLILLTQKLQDLTHLRDEEIDGVKLGDMLVVQSRCNEFHKLSVDYFSTLFLGLRDHLNNTFNIANTKSLEEKCESIILLAPLFVLIKDFNEPNYNELKSTLTDSIASTFKTELDSKVENIMSKLIHIEAKDKGKLFSLPDAKVGNQVFEKSHLEEIWKNEEICDNTKYTINMAFHKVFTYCLISMIQIQFLMNSIITKETTTETEPDITIPTIDHTTLEASLVRVFNPVSSTLKKIIENENINPYLYITWIEEIEYIICRQDVFYSEGSLINMFKSLSTDLVAAYNNYMNSTMDNIKNYIIDIHKVGVYKLSLITPSFIDRLYFAYNLGHTRITEIESILDSHKYLIDSITTSYMNEYTSKNYVIPVVDENTFYSGECLNILVSFIKAVYNNIQMNSVNDDKYYHIFKMQNYYFLNRTLSPRHIENINDIIKLCDAEYSSSRVEYVNWILDCSIPSYFDLYRTILTLLKNKSVQELPHHISKTQFAHTFTVKNLPAVLKAMNKRVHKHISASSGLFTPIWEMITRTFEDYCRQIQDWAQSGYNGVTIYPLPEDVGKQMALFQ